MEMNEIGKLVRDQNELMKNGHTFDNSEKLREIIKKQNKLIMQIQDGDSDGT